MSLVPIYLNRRNHNQDFRHSFEPDGDVAFFYGRVLAPPGSEIVDGSSVGLLEVPTPSGRVRLSAADACEQATVGGCGLTWVRGVPLAWRKIRGAAS